MKAGQIQFPPFCISQSNPVAIARQTKAYFTPLDVILPSNHSKLMLPFKNAAAGFFEIFEIEGHDPQFQFNGCGRDIGVGKFGVCAAGKEAGAPHAIRVQHLKSRQS